MHRPAPSLAPTPSSSPARTTTRRAPLLAAALTVGAGLALAGCGSSSTTSPSATSSTGAGPSSVNPSSPAGTSPPSLTGPSSAASSSAATTGSPTPTAGPAAPSSATARVGANEAKNSLARTSGSHDAAVVAVGDGYEGATADAHTMHFWRASADGVWRPDGTSPRIEAFAPTITPDRIETQVPTGSEHAVFLLHAPVGGTGSSPNDQVFARGDDGWGALSAGGDDALAIVHGGRSTMNMTGAWHSAAFADGRLVLGTFATNGSNADGYVVRTTWRAHGGGFALVSKDDPSTKKRAFTSGTRSQFTSPSGRNFCTMLSESVGCTLSTEVAAQHDGANNIMLDGAGWSYLTGDAGGDSDGTAAEWARRGDGPPPPQQNGTYALPYGSSITNGAITCASSPEGFSCRNDVAGFLVNSEGVTPTGTKDPQSR